MSKPIAVPARPAPSHTPLLASADDTAPSQPVSPRPACSGESWSQSRSRGPGRYSEMWSALSRQCADRPPFRILGSGTDSRRVRPNFRKHLQAVPEVVPHRTFHDGPTQLNDGAVADAIRYRPTAPDLRPRL